MYLFCLGTVTPPLPNWQPNNIICQFCSKQKVENLIWQMLTNKTWQNGFKLSPWINNGSRVNSKTRPQSIPTHNERDRRVDSRLLQERALVIALLFLTYLILHESLSSCGVEQEGHRRIPTVDHTGERNYQSWVSDDAGVCHEQRIKNSVKKTHMYKIYPNIY